MSVRARFEAELGPLVPDVYRFIRLNVPVQDAQDVLQETMLCAYRAYASFTGQSSRKTWLLSIARRRIADHFRGGYRRQALEGSLECPSSQADDPAAQIDERVSVHAALESLDARQQELCHLVFVQRLGYEEIAALLEIPAGTVKSRMAAIRARLKAKLS